VRNKSAGCPDHEVGTMERLEKILELMKDLIKGQFTGYIKINFSQGGISRVEKFEEVLRK
jgi:hypothetical protein